MPHPSYFERVYKICRENGALFIADETQTGLGRTGDHYWGFQNYRGFIPDIVTCGRPLGSGHPIGAAVTSERVSKKLGAYFSTFGGNPVSCAIGNVFYFLSGFLDFLRYPENKGVQAILYLCSPHTCFDRSAFSLPCSTSEK